MSDLGPLFERIRNEQDAWRARAAARGRSAPRLHRVQIGRHRAPARVWLAALALGGLLLAAGARWLWPEPQLSATLGDSGAEVPMGVWFGAPDERRVPLRFSEGTRVELLPRARARVVSLSERGAALELERGRLTFDVVPRQASEWLLRAGPFQVLVTGTRFEVHYEPDADRFELSLHEGQVQVSGCGFGKGRQVAPGQTARASCADSMVTVDYGDLASRRSKRPGSERKVEEPPVLGERPAVASPAAAPTEVPRSGAESASAPLPGQVAPDARANALGDWRALARRGAYAEALEAAETADFAALTARVGADELALLGDAARHAGAPARAVQAYRALRRRFPGSSDAALAAFTLGRLEFDAFGNHAQAARWFQAYLAERPGGSLAREALGRLMESQERSGNRAGARKLARRYLAEYPAGPHAKLAARLLTPR